MALRYFLCFCTIGTIVKGTFGQDGNESGPGGYDLERGPVFYEAYPEDQVDEFASDYREKRFFDRGVVRERSFQLPTEYSYDGSLVDVSRSVPDNLPNVDERKSELDSPMGNNYFSRPINEIKFSHVWSNRRPFEENDRQLSRSRRDKGQRAFERMGRRSRDDFAEIDPAIWPTLYWQSFPKKIRNLREELPRSDSRISPREFGSSDLVRRAPLVPRYLESQGLIPESRPNDPTTYWSARLRPSTILQKYPRRIDDSELWRVGEKRSMVAGNGEVMENIFEPRPQIINYVFSRKPAKPATEQSTTLNQSDEKPKNEPQVASIQVSETPRHKTRHHHGEWLMRENSRRSHM